MKTLLGLLAISVASALIVFVGVTVVSPRTQPANLKQPSDPQPPAPAPSPFFVRVTLDADLYDEQQRLSLKAGDRVKVVKTFATVYAIESDGHIYALDKAITTPE